MTNLAHQSFSTAMQVHREISMRNIPFNQHGRSLIELLIGMLIAIIALGAIVTAITNTSVTGEQQNVQAQLNEEAALASALIASHFRMAGSSVPIYVNASANAPSRNFEGPAIRGCDGGLSNPTANFSFTAPPPNPCVGGAGADAVTVLYEATLTNTIPTAVNLPTDCLGAGILQNQPSNAPGALNYSLAENRFYIDPANNALMCAGSGNYAGPQALINNVQDMQVTYGVSNVVNTGTDFIAGVETVAYLTATQVDALPIQGSLTPWNRVISARICLLIFSEPNALSAPMQNYVDCNNIVVVPVNDRRLFRQVNIVVSARNQAAPCANTVQVAAAAGPARQDLCSPPAP